MLGEDVLSDQYEIDGVDPEFPIVDPEDVRAGTWSFGVFKPESDVIKIVFTVYMKEEGGPHQFREYKGTTRILSFQINAMHAGAMRELIDATAFRLLSEAIRRIAQDGYLKQEGE